MSRRRSVPSCTRPAIAALAPSLCRERVARLATSAATATSSMIGPCQALQGQARQYRKLLDKLMGKAESDSCNFDISAEILPSFLQCDQHMKDKFIRNLTQHIEQIRTA
eukprot:CAMPEP_0115596820 /NCGR_PEP_ID=MMETSP0272-20121206/13032_1 /TAXON_ID=71861 /ORGANISM="Scrippsiella trochoidea, Strain CCMP3099" /LENGTH=108 /DNA_ID=CAMNT_0003032169 /DNA_START=32 /DNA_END=359 /DNA_ORIENTATION=-